jgi:hypothetical protein
MSTLTALKGFIARNKEQEVITIIMHTPQVTQAMSFP